MTELAPDLLGKAIERAYLAPVRSVMLVDEDFPEYGELAAPPPGPGGTAAEPPKRRNAELAALLWRACRARGWVCDIDRGTEITEEVIPSAIVQCDLLVLDYHLAADDPSRSLAVLEKRADAERAGLVIVYTQDEDLRRVRRTIAARLKGLPPSVPEAVRDAVEEHDLSKIVVSTDTIDEYLRDERQWRGTVTAAALAAGVPRELAPHAAIVVLQEKMRLLQARARPMPHPFEMCRADSRTQWISCGNMFVVCVPKKERGAGVFDALKEALLEWCPPPLFVVLAFARDAIAKGGLRADQRLLASPELHLAWLLHSVRAEGGQGLRTLMERLLDTVADGVLRQVHAFGDDILSQMSEQARAERDLAAQIDITKRYVKESDRNSSQQDILAALNCYLCSEQFSGGHVRTGTVFTRATPGGAADEYWICATPACDMVPREPTGRQRWMDDLSPISPMTVLRTTKVALAGALEVAEQGRHAFVQDSGTLLALEAISFTEREPRAEVMFAEQQARVNEDKLFKVHLIKCGPNGTPEVSLVEMRVVAQLRPPYGSRLLQNAGVHASRIGVDFVADRRLTQKPK